MILTNILLGLLAVIILFVFAEMKSQGKQTRGTLHIIREGQQNETERHRNEIIKQGELTRQQIYDDVSKVRYNLNDINTSLRKMER